MYLFLLFYLKILIDINQCIISYIGNTSYAWLHDGPLNLSQCPSYTLFGVSEAKRPEATFPSISYYVSGLLSSNKCIALV